MSRKIPNQIVYTLYECKDGRWVIRQYMNGKSYGSPVYCDKEGLVSYLQMIVLRSNIVYDEVV